MTPTANPSELYYRDTYHRNGPSSSAGYLPGQIRNDNESSRPGQAIWHMFDTARGIDVDSPMFQTYAHGAN